MATSSKASAERSEVSTVGYVNECGPYCGAASERRGGYDRAKTDYGPMPTLQTSGCSPWPQLERTRADLEGVLTNRKAGCGKSARPVWREGWRENAIPTPIEPRVGATKERLPWVTAKMTSNPGWVPASVRCEGATLVGVERDFRGP